MTNSFTGLSVQKVKPPSKGGLRGNQSPKTALQKGEALAKKLRTAKRNELISSKRSKLPGPSNGDTDSEMPALGLVNAITSVVLIVPGQSSE